MGLDLNYYWDITPNQFKKHIEGYIERKQEEARELDAQNFNLGKYVSYGVNDPKKYPDKPFLSKEVAKERVMTDEEMQEVAKRLNAKFNTLNKRK